MRKCIVSILFVYMSAFAENQTAPVDYLKNYSADFTDTDMDGMTDVYELKYGYDPNDSESFPPVDFLNNSDLILDTDVQLGSDSNKIYFEFKNFTEEQTERYVELLRRVIPIMMDVVGNPTETYVCTIEMQPDGQGSWATFDQGRLVMIDSSWVPRLFVHELIHVWDGKYGFSWSGENRSYSDDLSAFSEVAEGIAYEVLHKFIEVYPTHFLSEEVATGADFINWPRTASGFDVQKHQKHLRGGDLWSEVSTVSDKYGISAMTIQNFMIYDEDFYSKMRKRQSEILLQDESKIFTRNEIIDLWESVLPNVNGVNTRKYLESIPMFDGMPLQQKFYPVLTQDFRSDGYAQFPYVKAWYPLDGYAFWYGIRDDKIDTYNIPDYIKYTIFNGFVYNDTGEMPYTIKVKNLFGETLLENSSQTFTAKDDVGDATHPGEDELIETLHSDKLSQGLYVYNLKFTDERIEPEDSSEDFYFFGTKDFDSTYQQHSFFIGVDSKFAESIKLEFEDYVFELPIINGCAILRTDEFLQDTDGILYISVSSNLETHRYERAFVSAGDNNGRRHLQFLIIDQDFDGIEDLYDEDVNHSEISSRYESYLNQFPNHRTSDEIIDWKLIYDGGRGDDGSGTYEVELSFVREGDKIIMSLKNTEEYYFDSTNGVKYGDVQIPVNFEFEFHTTEGERVSFNLSDNGLTGNEILTIGNFSIWTWEESTDGSHYVGHSKTYDVDLSKISNDSSSDNDNTDNNDSDNNNTDVDPIDSDWDNVTEIGDNWKYTDWFGYYYESQTNPKWKYHLIFGWIYVPGNSFDSIWMYSEKFGWIWSKYDFLPYVYIKDNWWVYFEEGRYYDFQTKKYISF